MNKYLIILTLFFGSFSTNNSYAFCFGVYDYPPHQGIYMSAVGGFSGGFDLKCEDVSTNLGYYVGGKIGTTFSPIIRFEGECIFQRSNVGYVQTGTIQLSNVHGNINVWALMTNIVFNLNCEFPLIPFIGGGLGYGQANGHWKGSLVEMVGNHLSYEEHIKAKFNKQGFAWQVLAGLRYYLCQRWEASLEYRYLKIEERRVSNHKLGLALTRFF
jgi:opacity protein-like surface antigen